VSQLKETLSELARILRPGGYLILREHDCKSNYTLSAKYLNFVHAIMMIARVGEFADSPNDYNNENSTKSWPEQKSCIIEYTKSIHYRTCDEWKAELESVGFSLRATFYYGADGAGNPQKLFYAVYQLNK
jgi:ubiquinone/menaquinone biosynthesis C-methylase UbiE